jgi:hypothetical protein
VTYPQPKKKHTGRNVVFAVGGLMVLAVIGGALGSAGETGVVSPSQAYTTTVPTPETHPCLDGVGMCDGPQPPAETAPVAPPAPAGPASSVSDGTYEVGSDIVAGKYKGQCGTYGYWARLKANDGLLGDIVANDFLTAPGQMTFTAKKGEYVEVRGCTFTKVG